MPAPLELLQDGTRLWLLSYNGEDILVEAPLSGPPQVFTDHGPISDPAELQRVLKALNLGGLL